MRRTLPLFVLLLTLVSIHSASQQRKVIHDRAKYQGIHEHLEFGE